MVELNDEEWSTLGDLIQSNIRKQVENGVIHSPVKIGYEVKDKSGNILEVIFNFKVRMRDDELLRK